MTTNTKPPWSFSGSESEERDAIMRDIGILVGRLVDLEINSERHQKAKDQDAHETPKVKIGDEVIITIRGVHRGKRAVVDSRRGTYWNLRLHDAGNLDWKSTGTLIHKKDTSFTVLH